MKQYPPETVFQWQAETTTAGATRLIDQLLNLLVEYHWPDSSVFEIHTTMVELINNAMEHGNRYDPAKNLFLAGRVSANGLTLSVRDEGNGFEHEDGSVLTHVPEPLDLRGRGLFLVRNLTTRVRFNQAGNEVMIEKELLPITSCTRSE